MSLLWSRSESPVNTPLAATPADTIVSVVGGDVRFDADDGSASSFSAVPGRATAVAVGPHAGDPVFALSRDDASGEAHLSRIQG